MSQWIMRKANIALAIAAVLILTGFVYLAIHSGVASQKLQMKTIKLQSTEQKLKSINIQYEKLDTQLKTESSTNKEKIEDLKAQEQKLQQEKQDLQTKLQSKAAEKQRIADAAAAAQKAAQTAAAPVAYAAEAPVLPSGSHTDWMAQAGISASDYGYVDYIVNHEGHYDACVRYGNIHDCSGWQVGTAYGVCQSLPGTKMATAGADWATNPITQLRWCNSYAQARYGGWANAYYFWVNHRAW